MANPIKLGVLEFGERSPNLNSLSKVGEVVEYAILADQLGFSRFWMAEHHVCESTLTWSSPQMLLPIIAGCTNNIRVGAAGVLLGLYSPYHIATSFKLINNLYGNRIDLGFANGTSSERITQLSTGQSIEQSYQSFGDKVVELCSLLKNEDEHFNNGKGFVIPPFKGAIPELWALGVGYGNALERALICGTHFSRSIFHFGSKAEPELQKIKDFRENFAQKHGFMPQTNLSLSGICLEDETEAKAIAQDLEKRVGYQLNLVGNEAFFLDKISEYQHNFGFDEIIFLNALRVPEQRQYSLNILSELFCLKPADQYV